MTKPAISTANDALTLINKPPEHIDFEVPEKVFNEIINDILFKIEKRANKKQSYTSYIVDCGDFWVRTEKSLIYDFIKSLEKDPDETEGNFNIQVHNTYNALVDSLALNLRARGFWVLKRMKSLHGQDRLEIEALAPTPWYRFDTKIYMHLMGYRPPTN